MAQQPREALIEGLSDAVGFVFGALAGWQLGKLLGFDVFGTAGWDTRAMVGVVFIALGCGAGKWAAMRWRAGRNTRN